jgi:hypothetical protein
MLAYAAPRGARCVVPLVCRARLHCRCLRHATTLPTKDVLRSSEYFETQARALQAIEQAIAHRFCRSQHTGTRWQ